VKRNNSKDYVQLTSNTEIKSLNTSKSKHETGKVGKPYLSNSVRRERRAPSSTPRAESRTGEDSAWCVESSQKADEVFANYIGRKTQQTESPLHILSEDMSRKVDSRLPPASSEFNIDDGNSRFDNVDELIDELVKNKNDASATPKRKETVTAALATRKPKDTITPPQMSLKQNSQQSKTTPMKTLEEYMRTSQASTGNSPDIPVDPLHLKSNGIMIVDPKQNGKKYNLSEKNRSLTNKDLLIIRKKPREDVVNDDESIISNLTEVTYKQAKEERLKMIMNNLNSSPTYTNPENQACCAGLPLFSTEEDECLPESQYTDVKGRNVKHSLTGDAALFVKSLVTLMGKDSSKVNFGDFSENVIVCITRIYMATQEEVQEDVKLQNLIYNNALNEGTVKKNGLSRILGLRCVSKDPTLSHDLGVRFIEGSDGQAVVREVISESTAGRSGVKVGDSLSFAVPLNNTFQGYERACDFISRLEMIGMRTSYRELFDMFLSKTSSGWPLAIVFRRKSTGMLQFERISFGLSSLNLEVDILRATKFLHELITRSREYDYYREADGIYEIVRGNIEYFLPQPRLREGWPVNNTTDNGGTIGYIAKSIGFNNESEERIPFLPISSNASQETEIIHPSFRRCSLLTGYAENAIAVLFVRCSGSFGGSGVAVFRLNDSSWSAPSAIHAKMSVGIQLRSTTIDCITFLQSEDIVNHFKEKGTLTIDSQNHGRLDYLSFTKINGSFFCTIQLKCSFEIREDLNKSFYEGKLNENITTADVVDGKIQNPTESMVLLGALRRLEFSSTMYPHPTPPENLVKYTQNDWSSQLSCKPSCPLEPPLDESGSLTLRELIALLIRHPVRYSEESTEFEVFTQKFKQMLYDGVSIDRIWPLLKTKTKDEQMPLSSLKNGQDHKGLLKLNLLHGQLLRDSSLKFLTRAPTESRKISKTPQDGSIDLMDPSNTTELKISDIICISQSMTKKFLSPKPPLEKDKKKKRYVSIEIKGGKKLMFLARTGKDASLLSCGLKLLVELSFL